MLRVYPLTLVERFFISIIFASVKKFLLYLYVRSVLHMYAAASLEGDPPRGLIELERFVGFEGRQKVKKLGGGKAVVSTWKIIYSK